LHRNKIGRYDVFIATKIFFAVPPLNGDPSQVRGPMRLIEIVGIALLLIVLAVVSSRVSAEGDSFDGGVSLGKSSSDGASDLANLVDRLRAAGLTVTIEGEARIPQLAVTGQMLTVDGEAVEVFAYADSWSAEADAAKISEIDGGVGTEINDWIDTPRLFRDDRLLVVHLGGTTQLDAVLSGLLVNSPSSQNPR